MHVNIVSCCWYFIAKQRVLRSNQKAQLNLEVYLAHKRIDIKLWYEVRNNWCNKKVKNLPAIFTIGFRSSLIAGEFKHSSDIFRKNTRQERSNKNESISWCCRLSALLWVYANTNNCFFLEYMCIMRHFLSVSKSNIMVFLLLVLLLLICVVSLTLCASHFIPSVLCFLFFFSTTLYSSCTNVFFLLPLLVWDSGSFWTSSSYQKR